VRVACGNACGVLRDKKRFCKRFLSLKTPLKNYN